MSTIRLLAICFQEIIINFDGGKCVVTNKILFSKILDKIMAVHLHIKKGHSQCDKESILHSIPCKIYSDDSANVSKFFTPYIRTTDNINYDASLRGYPLHGKIIKVPKGYKGITFHEKRKPENPQHERKLESTGKFSEFTYWNYDKLPSKNDVIISALEWIDIAEAIHAPSQDTT